jgi:5S rRNA maturation endonuclease (ribonuclease M5)
MTSATDILRSAGITTKFTGPGRYYATCPRCSLKRRPAHQKLECLGITIDEKGVTWGCNHCGWKGGNFYEPRPAGKKNGSGYSPVIAQYVYKQADGTPYLKVCKTENKKFLQFHWNGSAWIAGKPKGPKIPYRLPELLAAAVGTTIYFCEGEKDADALHALGLLGTTCSEGAPNGWRDELAPWFKDRHVVVLPDNDDAGRKLARKVAKALLGIAASVKIVELPNMKQGQDVSDFLERDRAGVKFIQLCKAAPLWEPSKDSSGGEGKDDTSDDELVAQLAALPRLEYAKRRTDAAKRLGIRLLELDKIVAEARGEIPAATPERWSVAPWDTVVDTAELLAALRDTFMRHLILLQHAATAMALWTLHAWALAAAYVSPFLMFSSPEMRCGKSTALAVLYWTGPRTALASNISPAAIFRYIEASHPTLLIDEAETFVTGNEEVRGILNSGHTRDTAIIIRLVGDNHEPKEFSTWSAKAIASIGKLSGTLRDRSIILPMRRKKPSERVAKLRGRDTDEFLELRRKARRWADDNVAALKEACPSIPEALNDRAADNWEPLLAIADLAGNEWPRLARTAAGKLTADSEAEAESKKVRLLADIRAVFEELAVDRLPSATLVAELAKDADGPWAAYGRRGKPITQRQVATLLSDFTTPSGAEIKPRNIRTDGKVPKGYARDDFADAFERYLSPSPLSQSATPLQTNDISDLKEKSSATPDFFVADENEPTALKSNACSGVADRDPPVGEEGDRTCAQCRGLVDGHERQVSIGGKTLWLHPECVRFYLEAETLPW